VLSWRKRPSRHLAQPPKTCRRAHEPVVSRVFYRLDCAPLWS
jgi:hypothetical protein